MASSQKFSSMPNFRKVDHSIGCSSPIEGPAKLYRSSRPDFLTSEEIEDFKNMGIRCILDCRSAREYKKASGNKMIDRSYPVLKVKLPHSGRHKRGQMLKYNQLNTKNSIPLAETKGIVDGNSHVHTSKHYLLDFFNLRYIWAIYSRAPWYLRLYSLLFLIVDLILSTNYKHFVRCFARNVLNKEGLLGQYCDMITYSQAPIYAGLKILSEEGNVPAMINCAHGKDRTGVITALVLSCLGKSKEFIANDYARSETELAPMKQRLHAEIIENFHMCPSFTTAKAEIMMKLLEFVERSYGSIPNYLESIGFTPKDQEALKRNLTTL